MKTGKIKIIIPIIIFITFYYILFSVQDTISNWRVISVSIVIVLFLQFGIAIFIQKYYKKIIKNNSIAFTVLSLYIYSVTLFFFFAVMVIKLFKIIL